MGAAGLFSALPEAALGIPSGAGRVVHEVVEPAQDMGATPKYSIKFSVCGMSHDHIYGMVGAVQRGGGVLVSAYGAEPDKVAAFTKRFPDVKMVKSEEEILNDPSIQLVLSSTVPNERASLGVRVMKHGKDYLSDKPGATTLEQIEDIRKVSAETKLTY